VSTFHALALAAALSTAPAPPRHVVSYELLESSRSTSPAGERESAVGGTVEVAGEKGRFVASSGRLPRASASTLLWDEKKMTLVDPSSGVAADVRREELESLFGPEAGVSSGPLSSAYRDVEVKLEEAGSGVPFQGRATRAFRLEVSFKLVVTSPGRVTRVTSKGTARIETLDEEDAASPLDGLSRLFGLRGDVREAVEKELTSIRGLVVSFRFDSSSEMTAEGVGMGPLPEGNERPLKSSRTATRRLSALSRRKENASDAVRFKVPENVRSVSLERLRLVPSGLP
jgi:hypothetical protein